MRDAMWARLFALAAATVLLFGCGDDEDDDDAVTATPPLATATQPAGRETPAATGTADAGDEDPAAFREFAALIDDAVETGDTQFFAERLKTTHVVCDETNTPPEVGDPACEFIGQEFEGFQTGGWRSEGAVVPAERVPAAFQRVYDGALADAQDEFAGGAPDVYAISDDGTEGAAAITALVERPSDFAGTGPLRVVLSTSWVREDDGWLMDLLISAYVLAEDFLQPSPEVSSYYRNWERFQ
jgi:hypothetical protein